MSTKKPKTATPARRGPGSLVSSRDGGYRTKRYVRFSDLEWAYVAAIAESSGESISTLVRRRMLRGMERTNPHATD